MLAYKGTIGKQNWHTLTLYYFNVNSSTSELVTGVVSSALQCGTGMCPTDDLQLDTPVRITIEHSDTVKVYNV